MELEARLRTFAAFARRRSFSAAARELRISQPAVSKHIADVEREVGGVVAVAVVILLHPAAPGALLRADLPMHAAPVGR